MGNPVRSLLLPLLFVAGCGSTPSESARDLKPREASEEGELPGEMVLFGPPPARTNLGRVWYELTPQFVRENSQPAFLQKRMTGYALIASVRATRAPDFQAWILTSQGVHLKPVSALWVNGWAEMSLRPFRSVLVLFPQPSAADAMLGVFLRDSGEVRFYPFPGILPQ